MVIWAMTEPRITLSHSPGQTILPDDLRLRPTFTHCPNKCPGNEFGNLANYDVDLARQPGLLTVLGTLPCASGSITCIQVSSGVI